MVDIQKLFDVMSAESRRDRSRYHLTLGDLIEELEKLPGELPVGYDTGGWPVDPDSYRGYYADLAFDEQTDGASPPTVEAFLKECRDCLYQTFTGYKGGDFVMGEDTPLWVSGYGRCSGVAVVGLSREPNRVVLLTKNVDD